MTLSAQPLQKNVLSPCKLPHLGQFFQLKREDAWADSPGGKEQHVSFLRELRRKDKRQGLDSNIRSVVLIEYSFAQHIRSQHCAVRTDVRDGCMFHHGGASVGKETSCVVVFLVRNDVH